MEQARQPGTARSLSHKFCHFMLDCTNCKLSSLQDSAAFHHFNQDRGLPCASSPVQECFYSRIMKTASASFTEKNSLRG